MRRNETPFLHLKKDNVNARRIYERMGFRYFQEGVARVLSRCQW